MTDPKSPDIVQPTKKEKPKKNKNNKKKAKKDKIKGDLEEEKQPEATNNQGRPQGKVKNETPYNNRLT